MKKNIFQPLVSIVVITYNNAAFVLETLESAKKQIYKNIELIITDDASIDNTADLCRSWVEQNSKYFTKVELLISPVNKGIPGNCNSGLKRCKGEWVKLIAGDDLLLPNCIQDYVDYVKDGTSSFVFSYPKIFCEWIDIEYSEKQEKRLKLFENFYNLTAREQFLYLLIKPYPMNPPTLFAKRESLFDLGGFNEKFVNEDFPFYLKATYSGYKLYFLKKQTIIYRIHQQSISKKVENNEAVSYFRKLKMREVIREYINWKLFYKHPLVVGDYINQFIIDELVIFLGNEKRFFNFLKVLRFASPIYVWDFVKRQRKKETKKFF